MKMYYNEDKNEWVTESESEAAALKTKYFCFATLKNILESYLEENQIEEIFKKLEAAIDETGQEELRIQDTEFSQIKEIVFKRTEVLELAMHAYNNHEMFCEPHSLSNNKAVIRDKVEERKRITSSQKIHTTRREDYDEH